MKVGSLGDIVFEVRDDKIITPRNVKWTDTANFAEHSRHCSTTLVEYVGDKPDTITLLLKLSDYLGVKTMEQLKKLKAYKRSGKTLRLILGKKPYGRWKWVITKISVSMEYSDKRGNLTQADVQISLKEYIKR
jgi:phage protein U|nr:MAG TPA: hypothetical protein [Caudoviricetes sp.]